MKTTLPSIKDLLEFLHDKYDFISILKLMGHYYFENIFLFPALLEETSWEKDLDAGIEVAKKYDMEKVISSLTEMKGELTENFYSPTEKND